MIRLVNSLTYKLDLEITVLKELMIMPGLLLQKTLLNSKSKENSETLKRRLLLWKNEHLDQLMFEGKTIQDRLQNSHRVTSNNSKEALTFERLIEEGKVNTTIQILEKANKGRILPLGDETLDRLQQKHPKAFEASDDILPKRILQEVHPVICKV